MCGDVYPMSIAAHNIHPAASELLRTFPCHIQTCRRRIARSTKGYSVTLKNVRIAPYEKHWWSSVLGVHPCHRTKGKGNSSIDWV
jgi:hypothetical protein